MTSTWNEISVAIKENRHELKLQGPTISGYLEANGVDSRLYQLTNLNYLDFSNTCLTELSDDIGSLVNLTNLVLDHNKLTRLPETISNLKKLKCFDVSNNQLESIPESISGLTGIHTLNCSMNKIEIFPSIEKMTSVHILIISNNSLTSLPEGIYSEELSHLSQIQASDNQIEEIQSEISELPHLNLLDLSNNKLSSVPAELSACPKLKELNLKGNKFKDRRFGKLVEQCPTKSVLDYLANVLKKEQEASGKKDKKQKDKKKKGKKANKDVEEVVKDMINILHFQEDEGYTVQVTPAVLSVRQYVLCCIVRQLYLKKSNMIYKHFITLQTKLHDEICQKRQAATIATHDLKSIKKPIVYDAKSPHALMITPLFKQKEVSGEKLVTDLNREAEEQRKEKKRNTVSGIHKYLDLLKDKVQYPCLVDGEGHVISFPPITNSDKTKITKDTTDLFIEVTSHLNLDTCKKVMDELLYRMLDMGLGTPKPEEEGAEGGAVDTETQNEASKRVQKTLIVEQVQILDTEGNMKAVYPSRADLPNEAIKIIRNK
ncbi:leucine-rich repeat-containing protein 47-like [Mytilus galloprovincialis]|uniref:leucine-rich repeat-containing protein 47-like n=1 Tax=Mytilus galloprovincialis TaxID=29158 RepID=UPI003F7B6CD1